MKTIAVAIPHAAHKPERVDSVTRLLEGLGLKKRPEDPHLLYRIWRLEASDKPPGGAEKVQLFADREHYTAWSKKVWHFLEWSGCDYGLQIQDDTIVAPNFWRVLRAMLEAVPDQLVCLESAHPAAPLFSVEGEPWYTTSDMLIGNAYVAPPAIYAEFRVWRERRLREGALDAISEDTLFGIFCLTTGRKIWCPVRTIVNHDLGVPSTCGNEEHPNRQPLVRWDNSPVPIERYEDPDYWRPRKRTPHVGRGYGLTPQVANKWVKDLTSADLDRMTADDGRLEIERARASVKLTLPPATVPRVVIATPTRGGPSVRYMATVMRCIEKRSVEIVHPWDHEAWWMWRDDIIRTRSRMVKRFLESGATHLWFLDDDVSCEPIVLEGMLAVGRDFVACPYPSKLIDWAAVAVVDQRHPEARGMKYDNMQATNLAGDELDDRHCIELERAGLGCALITREGVLKLMAHVTKPEPSHEELLEVARTFLEEVKEDDGALIDCAPEHLALLLAAQRADAHARPPIVFDDPVAGPTAAPFALRFERTPLPEGERRDMLSEDLSFCARWRESGQQIWLYLGPGSPASHDGSYTFRGLRESLEAPTATPASADKAA